MVWLLLLSALAAAGQTPSRADMALQQARTAFEKRDLRQARAAAETALRLNPKAGDAEVLLGLIDTAESNVVGAEQHFSRAALLQPANPRVYGYLGSTYLSQRKFSDAERAFTKVLGFDPKNTTAHYNLGLIALSVRKPATALPHFQAVVKTDSSDISAWMALLETSLLLKNSSESARSVASIQRLLRADDDRLTQVGGLLVSHEVYALAIPVLERVRDAHPSSFEATYNLSLALLRAGEHERAIGAIQPFLGTAPKPEAYNLLGTIEERRGRYGQAKAAFAEAARLAPGNEDFRVDAAAVLMHEPGLEAAKAAFARALSDFPQSVRIRLGLGAVLYLAGDYEQSAKTLLEAVRIDPNAAPAYDLLGKTYESAPASQGEIERVFSAYVKRNPPDALAYLHYGTIRYLAAQRTGSRDFSEPKLYIRRSLEQDARLAQAHLQLGIIAQSEGKLEEARHAFEEAVRLAPSHAAGHYRLASLYQRLGNKEKAAAELTEFRKLKLGEQEQERTAIMRSIGTAR